MKCSYGCDYEPTSLADAARHSGEAHAAERAQRKADKAAAKLAAAAPTRRRRVASSTRAAAAPTPEQPPAGDNSELGDDTPTDVSDPAGGPDVGSREVAPRVAKPTWRERVWAPKKDKPAKPQRERKPKVVRKRVSTAKVLSDAWGGIGFGLIQLGVDPPVGRAMTFQGPAAGEVLEGLTKGTPLDRPLQYVAGRAEEAKAAKELFELPLLIFMYERANDDLRSFLEPMLYRTVRRNFVAMVPIVRKMREEETAWRDAVAELGLTGDDPVRDMLAEIFQPVLAEEPAP